MSVCWIVSQCERVAIYQIFRGTYCLHLHCSPEDWGSKYLRNVSIYLQVYSTLETTIRTSASKQNTNRYFYYRENIKSHIFSVSQLQSQELSFQWVHMISLCSQIFDTTCIRPVTFSVEQVLCDGCCKVYCIITFRSVGIMLLNAGFWRCLKTLRC